MLAEYRPKQNTLITYTKKTDNTQQVESGFPSPAADFLENSLNLHEHLVLHPASTFFMKAGMVVDEKLGIMPGDILVIDRAIPPGRGDTLIAVENGDLVVKAFSSVKDCEVWGIITYIIHAL